MENQVRVRFAPSPTGGLHLGGVRTALFNYLFARKNQGVFVLRIEDTDQNRLVEGAESYVQECLEWAGIVPDEGPQAEGPYGPYRQSERKIKYRQFAEQLIDSGHAYYAFDTPEEMAAIRDQAMAENKAPFQYDMHSRMRMKNSLTLPMEEVTRLLDSGYPHVIRMKVNKGELWVNDLIRGQMRFDLSTLDDKVLLKADGMPTYHLAVVVDDFLMKITHVLRGEEWLPSLPLHVLIWKFLGWEQAIPQWAHLPLILKPDGHGKLSKRDGDRLGFPVNAMSWTDPKTKEKTGGFREMGFLPEAFLNVLALLGWNDGTENEIFTLETLIEKFDLNRVNKAGARFDFDKAKWINQQHLQKLSDEELIELVRPFFLANQVDPEAEKLARVVPLIRDRCALLSEFWSQGYYFFQPPRHIHMDALVHKWDPARQAFFQSFAEELMASPALSATEMASNFGLRAKEQGIKKGSLLLPLRIMLVGDKFGPDLFEIAEIIGTQETARRIQTALAQIEAAHGPMKQ